MGKAVAAIALISGAAVVVAPALASAAGSVALYVAPQQDGGNDNSGTNPCTLASQPCATIAHALQEEALLAPSSTGSVINLSKGTFDQVGDAMFGAMTTANSGVTITGTGGKGKKATVVAPPNSGSLATVTGTSPEAGKQAIVAFNTGENGITVSNMTLSGASVSGEPNYVAGVVITDGTTGDAIVGDTIESGAFYGILTDDNADSTIISNNLSPVLCATTVKGPNTGLNAGWTSPATLILKTTPKCSQFVESGHGLFTGVFINGVAYCAAPSATKRQIVLTGTDAGGVCTAITNSNGPDIATGAQVIFNTSVAPFLQFGIACNSPVGPTDATTDCAISDNTVTAGGTVLGDTPAKGDFPPIGIVVTGLATANLDGNSVSGVADTIANFPFAGQTQHDGAGIALLPNATGASAGATVVGVNDVNSPNTGHGNKLAGNDIGILVVGGSPLAGNLNTPYQVNSNTVSSANQAGMVLEALDNGVNATLVSPMESNSVSGAATGAGIELLGVVGQTIGGPLASEGNNASGNGLGIALGPCTNALCQGLGTPTLGLATKNNLVQNNTADTNILAGVLTVGPYQPNEEVEQIPTAVTSFLSASGNTFNTNTWTGNGTLPSEVDGVNIMEGTGWGGGCGSICDDGPSLVYVGANQTLNATNPGTGTLTLAVCNDSAISAEPLPIGTEITLDANTAQAADGGTFFVTAAAIIPQSTVAQCTTGTPPPSTNITVQAVAPALVGTANNGELTAMTPASLVTGQPYILGTQDTILVNQNGAAVVALNSYGHGALSNSCTPIGNNGIANVFGSSSGNSVLNSSTGGVNATYMNC